MQPNAGSRDKRQGLYPILPCRRSPGRHHALHTSARLADDMNNEGVCERDEHNPTTSQERVGEDPEAVKELAENILHNATDDFDGLLQIPTVRPIKPGHYEMAFGHTRLAAFNYLVEQGYERYGSMRA